MQAPSRANFPHILFLKFTLDGFMSDLPGPVTANSCYGFTRKSVFERLPAILQTLLKQGAVEINTGMTVSQIHPYIW